MQKSLKPIDLSKILLPFESKWVALSADQKEVLGSGKTLKEAEKEIEIIAGFVNSTGVAAILGQEGFFDYFRIKFERDHGIIEVNLVK